MKLNLGSGNTRYDGYLNIDRDINVNPDYCIDIEDCIRLPFKDNSVTDIFAHHILEHMGDSFFHLIRELYRLCINGAIIDIRVPHPRHDIFLIDPTHKRPIYPHTLDMFSQEQNRLDMINGGSQTPLGIIHAVNLKVVEFQFSLDPYWQPRFQQMTEEECEHVARSFNNVITEIHIKWQVIK